MKEIIKVTHFSKSFEGKVIHSDVSFSVFAGECVGLVGGSGVGKSVFLRSLIGLEKPDSGEVLFKGQNVSDMCNDKLIELRKKVAYVFQNGALFDSMSVYDNVAYPLRQHTQLSEVEISARVMNLLNDFGLGQAAQLLPAEISGGMQKRAGLTRSIILEPEVILYDEPTAGLDPANTKNIQTLILKLKKQKVASILVTHDMPTALAVCDRVCLLKGGVIAADCTIEELKNNQNKQILEFIAGEGAAL